MKTTLIAATLWLATQASAFAAAKSCEELKAEIEAQLKARQVPAYTLDIVPADKPANGSREVGSCEGGKKKLIYVKGTNAKKP